MLDESLFSTTKQSQRGKSNKETRIYKPYTLYYYVKSDIFAIFGLTFLGQKNEIQMFSKQEKKFTKNIILYNTEKTSTFEKAYIQRFYFKQKYK